MQERVLSLFASRPFFFKIFILLEYNCGHLIRMAGQTFQSSGIFLSDMQCLHSNVLQLLIYGYFLKATHVLYVERYLFLFN